MKCWKPRSFYVVDVNALISWWNGVGVRESVVVAQNKIKTLNKSIIAGIVNFSI